MKSLLLLTLLAASSLVLSSCKSPKGNMPAYGVHTARPTPLQ